MMSIKIFYKIALFNSTLIVLFAVAMIGLSYKKSTTLFSDALNGIDVTVMDRLVTTLSDRYTFENGWHPLVAKREEWSQLVDQIFYGTFFELMQKNVQPSDDKATQSVPFNSHNLEQGMNACPPPFGTFLQRTSLLDADKKVLIAAEKVEKLTRIIPIRKSGEVIGWLEVGRINMDMLPLASYFFQQQLRVIYWVIALGALMAIVLGVIFARHITAPIRTLSQAALKIAKHDYQHHVVVSTKDELSDLADNFNLISAALRSYKSRQKQWLMDISHELRTPVAVLMSELYALRDQLTPFDDAALESLIQEVNRVKRLVEDLYELFKIEEQFLSIHKSPFDIVEMLSKEASIYGDRFDQKNLKIIFEEPSAPIIIEADAGRILQVIRNVLENALHYVASPGALEIFCVTTNSGIHLRFEDTGPGVEQAALDKLFNRLYCADESNRSVRSGLGIGLALCKEIVRQHQGQIRAYISPQGGLGIEIHLF